VRTLDARRLRASAIVDVVAAAVCGGGTVIFPTDTVYGIGCDPWRPEAVERIYALKNRPRAKPLSLHFGSTAELLEYASGNALAARAARAFLPGPLTLLVSRPSFVDERVTAGLTSLGLRVPKHELCRVILEWCGPLAATSANLSGAPAFTGTEGRARLPAADVTVDDGPTPVGTESTILDVSGGERARIVREGAISRAMLEEILGAVEPLPHAQPSPRQREW